MSNKPAGTSSLMPVKGSGCGIRPDLDEMDPNIAFDFSKAAEFLPENQQHSASEPTNTIDTKKVRK